MSFKIKANFASVADLAKGLENAQEVLSAAGTAAVNTVASDRFPRIKAAIVSQVALPKGYVDDRMSLRLAPDGWPVASITARSRPTTLARYNAQQVTKAAPRAKGDSRRAIPAGAKQAGISVNVRVGKARAKLTHAFFMPLRAGKVDGGNGMGVFSREGESIKHLYGPSVDQVFSNIIRDITPDVTRELEAELLKEVETRIIKAVEGK